MGKNTSLALGLAGALGAASSAEALTKNQVEGMDSGHPVTWSMPRDGGLQPSEIDGVKVGILGRPDDQAHFDRLQYINLSRIEACMNRDGSLLDLSGQMDCINAETPQLLLGVPALEHAIQGFAYSENGHNKLLIDGVEDGTFKMDLNFNGDGILEASGDPEVIHPVLGPDGLSFFTKNGRPYAITDIGAATPLIRDINAGTDTPIPALDALSMGLSGSPAIDPTTFEGIVSRPVRQNGPSGLYFTQEEGSADETVDHIAARLGNITPIVTINGDPRYNHQTITHPSLVDNMLFFNTALDQDGARGFTTLNVALANPEAPQADAGEDAAVAPDAAVDAGVDAALPLDAAEQVDAAVPTPDAAEPADAAVPTPDTSMPQVDMGAGGSGGAGGAGGNPTPDGGMGGTPTIDSGMGGAGGNPTPDGGMGGTPTVDSGMGGTPEADGGPQPMHAPYSVRLLTGNCVEKVLADVNNGGVKFGKITVEGDGSKTCTVEIQRDGVMIPATLTINSEEHGRMKITVQLPYAEGAKIDPETNTRHTHVDVDEHQLMGGLGVNLHTLGLTSGSAASHWGITTLSQTAEGHDTVEAVSFNAADEPGVFLEFPDQSKFELPSDGHTYLIDIMAKTVTEIPKIPVPDGMGGAGGEGGSEQVGGAGGAGGSQTPEDGGDSKGGCSCYIGGQLVPQPEAYALFLAALVARGVIKRRKVAAQK